MTWTLQDSVIDPLDLDDEVKDQAVAIAGESSVSLTADRENILIAAAGQVERYSGRAWFRGPGGAARVATSVIETDGGDVPAVAALPSSVGVTITSVEIWSDSAEVWTVVDHIRRPLGMVRVQQGGTYRIVTSVLPLAMHPSEVVEAVARLFAFLENLKPRMVSGDMSDGTIATQAGAIMKSGARSCCASRERGQSNGWPYRCASLSQLRMEASATLGVTGGQLALLAVPTLRQRVSP